MKIIRPDPFGSPWHGIEGSWRDFRDENNKYVRLYEWNGKKNNVNGTWVSSLPAWAAGDWVASWLATK